MADQEQQAEEEQQGSLTHHHFYQPMDIFQEYKYNESELIKNFRLDRATIVAVADLVRDKLQSSPEKYRPLTPETMVAIMLSYLGNGKMHFSCNEFEIPRSSITKIISKIVDALADPNILCKFLRFPLTQQEIQRKQDEFKEISGFPGIVGVIDGTYFRVAAPRDEELTYANSKDLPSVNVQVVCDAKYRILDVVARWPGSVGDVKVLDRSGIKLLFEQNCIPRECYLLGDSDYPCKKWLLTPYVHPLPGPQTKYNRFHRRAWCVMEQTIEQLKQRFRILSGDVRLGPEKMCKIIYVCAMLHNICKQKNIPLPEDKVKAAAEVTANGEIQPFSSQDEHLFRDHIVSLYFNVDD